MSESIDLIDQQIMAILQKNSRVTNTEIAKRLEISEGTVRNRIKKLTDHGVIRNITVINPETLGYQIHVMAGIEVEYPKMAAVSERLKQNESVHFLGIATGKYDLMVIAFFRDAKEQLNFYTKELPSIDGIRKVETFNILEMVKTKYLWGVSFRHPGTSNKEESDEE